MTVILSHVLIKWDMEDVESVILPESGVLLYLQNNGRVMAATIAAMARNATMVQEAVISRPEVL
ncbi:MAG: hypothetical protein AABY87_01960 [bacterium]